MMTEKDKAKFRRRKEWKEFRKTMKKLKKYDAITGSKLSKNFNLHHCDFNPEHYTNLDENNFECLNNMSHDTIHYFFGVPGQLKNWRLLILRTITILKKMERLNADKKN